MRTLHPSVKIIHNKMFQLIICFEKALSNVPSMNGSLIINEHTISTQTS